MDNYLHLLPPAIYADVSDLVIQGSNQYALAYMPTSNLNVVYGLSFHITQVVGTLSPSHVVCEVRPAAAPAGLPSSTVMASTVLSRNPTVGINYFSFGANGLSLTPGSLYWFCIKNTHPVPSSNNFTILRSHGGIYSMFGVSGYGPTAIAVSTNGGASWNYTGTMQPAIFRLNNGVERGGIFSDRFEIGLAIGEFIGFRFTPKSDVLLKGVVIGLETSNFTGQDYLRIEVYDTNNNMLWNSENFVMMGKDVSASGGLMTAVSETGYRLRAGRTYFVGISRTAGYSTVNISARWVSAGVDFQRQLGFLPVQGTPGAFFEIDEAILSMAFLVSEYTSEVGVLASIDRGVW